MARDQEDRRFLGGPRPLGALVPALTRPAFKRKSPAGAQIMADWPALVGPALAAVSQPVRLSSGTLTLACSGPVAMEMQHLAPQLAQRINAALGRVAVERFRFVQRAPAGSTPRPSPRQTTIALPDRVESALAGIDSPELRDALARLARGVYRNRG
jgi:hypothetical protein